MGNFKCFMANIWKGIRKDKIKSPAYDGVMISLLLELSLGLADAVL